jgi:type I restriction enzyme S subunit
VSWKTVELNEVCDFQNGFAFKSNLFTAEGLPILRISNIQNQKIDTSSLVYFNKESYKERIEQYEVKPNDLLIAMSGATTGKIGFNNTDKIFYLNQRVGNFKPRNSLDKKYLYYFLSTQVEKNLSISAGAAQPNLSTEQIKGMLIPLPLIAIQQKIVAKLDAIFAEIDTAMAASEANAKNAEALFQSYLTEVFERGGEGWETKKLCEVSSFDKNQGLHNGIPYIGMENIQSHTTQLISGVELVEEVKSSTFKFNETHLLYGRLRPYLNKVYAPDFVGHCSTEIFPIKPFSNLLRDYLKYWFINVKTVDRINATCTGARMPRANMNAVMDFDFQLPPISIQKQLIEYFDSVQKSTHIAIDSYKTKIAEITALKQSILQKAFSGELVKD